jgi:hypothetical protein
LHKDITIPEGLISIEYGTFHRCTNLKSITLPDNVRSIGGEAFAYCESLENVTIPNSVTEIGWVAFTNCKNLKSITIQTNDIEIGEEAFSKCLNLKSITIPDNFTYNGIRIERSHNKHMIKKQVEFTALYGELPTVGKKCTLQTAQGKVLTSPVVNYFINCNGNAKIETLHTNYIGYNVRFLEKR